jgi:hypothetical protein
MCAATTRRYGARARRHGPRGFRCEADTKPHGGGRMSRRGRAEFGELDTVRIRPGEYANRRGERRGEPARGAPRAAFDRGAPACAAEEKATPHRRRTRTWWVGRRSLERVAP